MKLSSSDLLTLRQRWVDDYVNDHTEVGRSAIVASPAVAGAASLSLSGLGSGTILKGTVLLLTVGGRLDRYAVSADATISGSYTATVSIIPTLSAAVPSSTRVEAERYYQSLYNKARGGAETVQFFADADLQELADRAESMYGARIQASPDPTEWLFRAIRLLANEAKLDSSDWHAAIRSMARDRYDIEVEKLQRRINEDRLAVATQSYGPRSFPVLR